MPVPKSVTKVRVKKGKVSVEYTSNVEAVNYTMKELCRAALRDVGKFVKTQFRVNLYSEFKRRTGKSGKGIGYRVYSARSTMYPRVDIGMKPGIQQWAQYQELGSSKTPKRGILTKTVMDNVSQIIAIESQYLSWLSSESPSIPSSEGDMEE